MLQLTAVRTNTTEEIGSIGDSKARGNLGVDGTADVDAVDMVFMTGAAATTVLGQRAPIKSFFRSSNGDNVHQGNSCGDDMDCLAHRCGSRGDASPCFFMTPSIASSLKQQPRQRQR